MVYYDSPKVVQETPLYLELRKMDSEGHLTRYFKWARNLLSELGPCAADLLWRQALLVPLSERDRQNLTKYKRFTENWLFDMPNIDISSPRCNVSHRYTRILDILRSADVDDDFRGIIYGI